MSGHTSGSFTAAALICAHHQALQLTSESAADPITCAAALVAAGAIGTLRIVGDAHYFSDVFVGAAVGTAVGLGIPLLHHYRRASGPTAAGSPFGMTLVPGLGGAQLVGFSDAPARLLERARRPGRHGVRACGQSQAVPATPSEPGDWVQCPRCRPGHWTIEPPRPFIALRADAGYLYLKPRLSLGYGKPFSSWAGIEAVPLVTPDSGGAYAGARLQVDWFEVRAGARYVHAFLHQFLTPKASYDLVDLQEDTGHPSNYLDSRGGGRRSRPRRPGQRSHARHGLVHPGRAVRILRV